jgi:hypothetical protein
VDRILRLPTGTRKFCEDDISISFSIASFCAASRSSQLLSCSRREPKTRALCRKGGHFSLPGGGGSAFDFSDNGAIQIEWLQSSPLQ